MLKAIRRRVAVSPAVVLSLGALVLAASGGAYATTTGSGSAKGGPAALAANRSPVAVNAKTGKSRYVISSTKQISPAVLKALKGRSGAAGPAGAGGKNGAAGANGTNGTAGTAGTAGTSGVGGANGKSVVVTSGAHGCPAGGVTVEVEGSGVKHEVCNGEEAEGGGFPKTLPEGATETGVWATEPGVSASEREETFELRTISFPIRLAAPILQGHAVVVSEAEQASKSGTYYSDCGGSAAEPKADEGYLCVYQGHTHIEEDASANYYVGSIEPPTNSPLSISDPPGAGEAGVSGAVLTIVFNGEGTAASHEMEGSWAVTGA